MERSEDIFPDCPAGIQRMTADEWVSGQECDYPTMTSMRQGLGSSFEASRSESCWDEGLGKVDIVHRRPSASAVHRRGHEVRCGSDQLEA